MTTTEKLMTDLQNSLILETTGVKSIEDQIHERVASMSDLELHNRRIELRGEFEASPGTFNNDKLSELCAILARLRQRKGGPAPQTEGEKKTRKKLIKKKQDFKLSNLRL